MQKVAACFGAAVRVTQAVVVDHVTDHSPECKAPTNMQTCLQAGSTSNSFQILSKECILCVQGWRYRRAKAHEQWADLHLGQGVQIFKLLKKSTSAKKKYSTLAWLFWLCFQSLHSHSHLPV
jgi:hypothetical protein